MLRSLFVLSIHGDTLLERHFSKPLRAVADLFLRTSEPQAKVCEVSGHLCAHITRGELRFLAILSGETEVAVVFELLSALADFIQAAYTNCDAEVVREHFADIVLAIEEMLEFGAPFNVQKHIIMHLLKPKTLFEKMKQSFTGTSNYIEESIGNEQLADNPWRPRGLRYTVNEILIDVVEKLNCTLDRHGNFLRCDIEGEISVNNSLSGMPDVTLFLNTPKRFLTHHFHPCAIARRKRYEEENVLVFTPPDGRFILFRYTIADLTPTLPFKVTPVVSYNSEGLDFQLAADNKMVLAERLTVTDFRVTFTLPAGLVKPIVTVNSGSYIYQEEARKGAWNIGNLTERTAHLICKAGLAPGFVGVSEILIPLEVEFKSIPHSFSGTKVDKLTFRGETTSAYRGARCVAVNGVVEVRAN